MHQSQSTGPRWYVISLRPRGGHAALRAAARRAGHGFVALSPLRIVPCDDDATRAALAEALAAEAVVFTSPAAVRAARALRPLEGVHAFAVGAGTARALRRAGAAFAIHPARMDSEGLLALPALADVHGRRVGVITAPGGRDRIGDVLAARGARLLRADVYRREACRLSPAGRRVLHDARGRAALALTSGEALDGVLAQLDGAERAIVLGARVLAASDRLAALARDRGFADVVRAPGPRPAQLVATLNHADA